MTAILTPPAVTSGKTAPNQNLLLESLGNEHVPQEKQAGPSLLGWILRRTLLLTFAAGALTLASFALNPAIFVTLLLLVFALTPVIVLGLAIVVTEDMQRDGLADASGQPCSCHRDRLASTF